MIRLSIGLIISLFLSSCSATILESETNRSKNLSNDEAVLNEVNRIMKSNISMDEICIDRPSSFKDLILVGFFAHDRGCAGGMKFYKGKEINNNTDHPEILNDNGWKDKSKREVLALNWVKDVSLAWSTPMESEDENFSNQEEYTFMPPTVKTENDEITVAIWVKQLQGKSAQSFYHLLTVVFSISKADIIRSQITDRFSVDFESE